MSLGSSIYKGKARECSTSSFNFSTACLLPCFHSRKAGQNLNFCAKRNGRNTTISGLNALSPPKNLNAKTRSDHHFHVPRSDQLRTTALVSTKGSISESI